MSEMIERVALAMFEMDVVDGMFEDGRGNSLPAPNWDSELGREWHPRLFAMARAAIEAMREPTDRMVSLVDGYFMIPAHRQPGRIVWQDMIDEALRDGPA